MCATFLHFKLNSALDHAGRTIHGESDALEAWFEQTADAQYSRELLFSTLFELMGQI